MPIDFDEDEFMKHGLQIIAQIEENFHIPKARLMIEARYVYESLIAELEGTDTPIGVWREIADKQLLTSRETHERQQRQMVERLLEKSVYN
jgi:hypothetical protein